MDLNINAGNTLEGTDLVNALLQEYPALKPLTLVVKTLLKMRDMNDAKQQGLNGFSTILLCVAFLKV